MTHCRTVLQVEVLYNAEDCGSVSDMPLSQVAYLITEGDGSGRVTTIVEEELDRNSMARRLEHQGSDPNFLIMDWGEEDGDEVETPDRDKQCVELGAKVVLFAWYSSMKWGDNVSPEFKAVRDVLFPDIGDWYGEFMAWLKEQEESDAAMIKDSETGAVFDDYTAQSADEDYDTTHWTQVCEECARKHKLLDAYLDLNTGNGICGVHGCANDADHYYDFTGEAV